MSSDLRLQKDQVNLRCMGFVGLCSSRPSWVSLYCLEGEGCWVQAPFDCRPWVLH